MICRLRSIDKSWCHSSVWYLSTLAPEVTERWIIWVNVSLRLCLILSMNKRIFVSLFSFLTSLRLSLIILRYHRLALTRIHNRLMQNLKLLIIFHLIVNLISSSISWLRSQWTMRLPRFLIECHLLVLVLKQYSLSSLIGFSVNRGALLSLGRELVSQGKCYVG